MNALTGGLISLAFALLAVAVGAALAVPPGATESVLPPAAPHEFGMPSLKYALTSVVPLQSSSAPLQISVAPGWIAAFPSLQSAEFDT